MPLIEIIDGSLETSEKSSQPPNILRQTHADLAPACLFWSIFHSYSLSFVLTDTGCYCPMMSTSCIPSLEPLFPSINIQWVTTTSSKPSWTCPTHTQHHNTEAHHCLRHPVVNEQSFFLIRDQIPCLLPLQAQGLSQCLAHIMEWMMNKVEFSCHKYKASITFHFLNNLKLLCSPVPKWTYYEYMNILSILNII